MVIFLKKKFFSIAYIALSIWILLIIGNGIVEDFYISCLNKDMEVEFVATGEKIEKALSNNIRIRRITVNGNDINLAKLELEDGWKYDAKNDFLYIYDVTESSSFRLQIPDVHSLDITFVSEVGSGFVECYINNERKMKENLYTDSEWMEITKHISSSIWVFPEQNLLMLGLAYLVSVCIALVLYKKEKHRILLYVGTSNILILSILALIENVLSIFVQYQGWTEVVHYMKKQPELFLKSFIFIFLLLSIFYLLFNRKWASFLFVGTGIQIIEILNQIKLDNREVPLLPWDITMAKEALSVAGNYSVVISTKDIFSLLVILVIVYCLIGNEKQKKEKKRNRIIKILLSIEVAIGTVLYIYTAFIMFSKLDNNTVYRSYQVDNYYERRGFIPSFFEYFTYLRKNDAPSEYTKEKMQNIVTELTFDDTYEKKEKYPNIIAIMSESFWDVSRVDTLKLNEPLLPVYEELKKESIYGELFTHVLNGGTVVSEFEFLTGFNGQFFPEDYMVYGSFLNHHFSSAVSKLENLGYETYAFHPFQASNYNRKSAYEYMGFDNCYFEQDFEDSTYLRNYISDQSMFEKMERVFEERKQESDVPVFLFGVTMQNHGGYWKESICDNSSIGFETEVYGEVSRDCIQDQISGIHESDRALGGLIDYFRSVDEDTIVIYFGDHVSDSGPNDDKLLEKVWKDTSDQYDYETHKVPYLVWDNFSKKSEYGGIMEINRFFPEICKRYGIETDLFWKFVSEISEVYSAADTQIVIGADGIYKNISDMNEQQKAYLISYQALQYDYIWGKRYTESLWN